MGEIRRRAVSSSEGGLGAPLVADQSFGQYTLVAKIGHGGMAEVFLAAAQGPAGFTKLSVVKRLHPHLEEEPALVGMFLDEARLAARLNHPNVVQTFQVGDVDGLHYLAMEYLEGQSLARILERLGRRGRRVPLALGCRIFSEALHGLAYAHHLEDYDGTPLGIVHRDVSPANLFLTYEGQVKVLDFGIAKASTHVTETRAGQVKGKYAYIAPEQARPGEHDHRSDLWSLGVVMWEAFAGRRLFKGASEINTLNNTLSATIPPLDEAAGVPKELAAIVDRALERDPDRRYASARDLLQDLEAFAASEGLRGSRAELGAFVDELFGTERDEQRAILKAHMAGELQGGALVPVPPSGSGSYSGVVAAAPARGPGRWAVALVFGLAALVGAMGAWMIHRGEGEALAPVAEAGSRPESSSGPESASASASASASESASESESESASEPEGPPIFEDEGREEPPVRQGRRRRAEPSVSRRESTRAAEVGHLTLDTTPWSEVWLGSRVLGTTPLRRVELPAGSHSLILVNSERGLRTTYQVTIPAGQTVTRRVGLE